MRLKRIQDDFRVFEVLDEEALLGPGPCTLYRVTKRGLTTHEAADILAREAGVTRAEVAYAGLKDKDGVTGQFMTVRGGKPVQYKDRALTLRGIGPARRDITSEDNRGNSFEIVVRDLGAGDMARLRRNMAMVKEAGLPAYFDDQRFGCLRHGQGFVVRQLLRGDPEGALRALMGAPSKYGNEDIERFKEGIRRRWGDWGELASFCRGRRGATLFEHLREQPDDFAGALVRGIATRERTIHLFAYQSHLWNRAAALWIQSVVPAEDLRYLPGDDGALPVPLRLAPELRDELTRAELPLFGEGAALSPDAERWYRAVFRAEAVEAADFLALDVSGFRPQSEPRRLMMVPEFLRAAPAEPDELYQRHHHHKMRLRFTLPRGHYATLVAKRLALPTSDTDAPSQLYVSRHRLDFPDAQGRMPDDEELQRRDDQRVRAERRHEWRQQGAGRGPRQPGPWQGKPGAGGERPDPRPAPGAGPRRPDPPKPNPWGDAWKRRPDASGEDRT